MNEALRIELEEMWKADQAVREEAMAIRREGGASAPKLDEIHERMRRLNDEHAARLREIVAECGWPGISLVGEKGAAGAFLALQHSDVEVQKRYLPLVREATESGESKPTLLPLLEDRIRLREGRNQLYGTQVTRNDKGEVELGPIEDPEHAEERRAELGLEPLVDHLKRFTSL